MIRPGSLQGQPRQEWVWGLGVVGVLRYKWIFLSFSRWRGRTSSKNVVFTPQRDHIHVRWMRIVMRKIIIISLHTPSSTGEQLYQHPLVCSCLEDRGGSFQPSSCRQSVIFVFQGGIEAERTKFNKPNYHALISIRGKPCWDTCRLNLYPDKPGTSVNVSYLW